MNTEQTSENIFRLQICFSFSLLTIFFMLTFCLQFISFLEEVTCCTKNCYVLHEKIYHIEVTQRAKIISLFYNMSARHERHDCDTSDTSATQVCNERHDCDTSETRVTRVRCKCDTSATRTTRVRHECYTSGTSATRVKNFYFDNDTSENIFSHPYTSYMANERLKREEKFHSKNYLLEMPHSHAKMLLKSAPQKLNFVMEKAMSKSY